MIYCCLPGTSLPCLSLSSSHWPIPFHLEQLCNYTALPQRRIVFSLFCIYYQSLDFSFCCFIFLRLRRGKDFCLNWDLALKCFKSACCMNKFVMFYSSCLNVNCMQYFVKKKNSFSFYIQPDHPAFLWLPSLALSFRVTTQLPFVSEPAPLLGIMTTASELSIHWFGVVLHILSESWASGNLVFHHIKDMPKSHQNQNKNLVLVTNTFCHPFSFTSRARRTKLVCTPPWLHYSCTFTSPFPSSTEAQ